MHYYIKIRVRLMGIIFVMLLTILGGMALPAAAEQHEMPVKEQTVGAALDYVKTRMGYSIWYNVNVVNLDRKVSVDYSSNDINKIMAAILKGQNLDCEIKGKTIAISRRHNGGRHRITGKVISSDDGEPLIGCGVKVKGKNTVAVTDIDGNYSIDADMGDEITFSYLQYTPVTKRVGDSHTINVRMMSAAVGLDDVVVTGYQTMKKYNMTGAVNVISEKEIDLRSTNSLESILEGAVPGLTVYNDEYRIRGGASLRAGTAPLFIVDNFEVEQMPENMDQIETISVLKDAAATAIWGSRAANGVIVITTKKGKMQSPKISYSGNLRVSVKPDLADLHRVNAEQLIGYDRAAFLGGYYFPGFFDYSKSGYSLSQEIMKDYLVDDISMLTDEQLAEMDARMAKLARIDNSKQIKDNLLRSAMKQSHMVSVSGGGDKINYFLSGSYTGSHSAYKSGDQNNLFEINSRLSYKLHDKVTLRSNIYATFTDNDNGYTSLSSDVYNLYPYQMLTGDNGERIYDYTGFNKMYSDTMVNDYGYYHEGKNLMEEVELADNTTKSTDYKIT